MHPIIADHPEFAELARRRVRLHQARMKHTERTRQADTQYRQALAEYRRRREAAVLAGEEPPQEPAPPRADANDEQLFIAESARIDADERTWLAEHADDVRRALADREQEVMAELRPLVREVDRRVAEVVSLVGAARQVQAVAGGPTPPEVDTGLVLSAARSGAPIIEAPVPPSAEDVAQAEPESERHRPPERRQFLDLRLQGRR